MKNTVLEVENLNTIFLKKTKELQILKNISFNLERGKVLGIVGESGSGKSITVNSIINLLENAKLSGHIKYHSDDNKIIELQNLNQYGKEFRSIRADKISMIFQDPMTALNPVYTIGNQIMEVLLEHKNISKKQAKLKTIEMLEKLGIKNARDRINDYPHQFSGGQLQRVVISMAMICNPDILIADEPTTALDVTIQAQILDLLKELKDEYGTSIILITHDLGVIAQMADQVAVMYAGEIVEIADVNCLFKNPLHPYTRSLLKSIPSVDNNGKKLHVIEGTVPSITEFSKEGCKFSSRIPWIDEKFHEKNPEKLHEVEKNHYVRCSCYKVFEFKKEEEQNVLKSHVGEKILEIKNVKKYYIKKQGLFKKRKRIIKALDDVSFTVNKGVCIGIIGESGCGKSTLAKSLMKLHDITDGKISINLGNGFQNIYNMKRNLDLDFRKKVQMVFQDPYSSLNPSKTIYESLNEPMIVHGITDKNIRLKKIKSALNMVNIPESYLSRYPHEFSGGQRQRICIARALCMEPEILILDEPVSALDLSVQAQVLNYLKEIQIKNSLSYIFISHDLGVVKYMCDYIYIIHNGRFVEAGTVEDIYTRPEHIYTKKLLGSIPDIDVNTREKLAFKRKEIEQLYKNNYSKFYKTDGAIPNLKKISDTHYVAIKE